MADTAKSDQTGYSSGSYAKFDDTISGSQAHSDKPVSNPPHPATAKPSLLLTTISGAQRFFSEHYKKISEFAVLGTVLIGIVTVAQTNWQLQTNQSNFEKEMDLQTRSTSALLFSDYITKLKPTDFDVDKLEAREKEIVGARTEFILNGVSHNDLRSDILSFVGSTSLSVLLAPDKRSGTMKSIVSVAGMSFDEGKISGQFSNVNFTSASFRKTKLQQLQAPNGTFYYTDMRDAQIMGGDFSYAQFNCTSLAGANILNLDPTFDHAVFREVDLRNISISTDLTKDKESVNSDSQLANYLRLATMNRVIVDDAVYDALKKHNKTGMVKSSGVLPSDKWLEQIRANATCAKPVEESHAGGIEKSVIAMRDKIKSSLTLGKNQ